MSGAAALFVVFNGAMHSASTDTHNLASDTHILAKAANKQLEMSERPWVYASNWSLSEPLSFAEKGGKISISAVLKNVGHSPAINARFDGRLISFSSTLELHRLQVDYCHSLRDSLQKRPPILGLGGDTIFPGEQRSIDQVIGMNTTEVANGVKNDPIQGKILPVLIGCVSYQFPFSSEYHQTGYTILLGHPQSGGWTEIIPKGSPKGVTLLIPSMGEWAN